MTIATFDRAQFWSFRTRLKAPHTFINLTPSDAPFQSHLIYRSINPVKCRISCDGNELSFAIHATFVQLYKTQDDKKKWGEGFFLFLNTLFIFSPRRITCIHENKTRFQKCFHRHIQWAVGSETPERTGVVKNSIKKKKEMFGHKRNTKRGYTTTLSCLSFYKRLNCISLSQLFNTLQLKR